MYLQVLSKTYIAVFYKLKKKLQEQNGTMKEYWRQEFSCIQAD